MDCGIGRQHAATDKGRQAFEHGERSCCGFRIVLGLPELGDDRVPAGEHRGEGGKRSKPSPALGFGNLRRPWAEKRG
jgi:hypothetical protein